MLPGFRFLITAIVMCMSVLVFGLGATSLMRAAHEDFATNTSWRAPPEPRFAEQDEAAKPPVLAVLSLEPRAAEPTVAPGEVAGGTAAASAEDAVPPPSLAPDTTAALSPAATPATAKPDSAASEPPNPAPAPTDNGAQSEPSPASTAVQTAPPAAMGATSLAKAEDSKPAAVVSEGATTGKAPPAAAEPAPPESQRSPAPVLADAQAAPVVDEAATRIATLGGPPVPIEGATVKAPDAHAERDAINKKLQAEHAKEQRRRLALRRERLAQQQAAAEQTVNLFAPHPLIGTPPTPGR
jgi:hypothetical protein